MMRECRFPMEDPIQDPDLIDSELKDVKLHDNNIHNVDNEDPARRLSTTRRVLVGLTCCVFLFIVTLGTVSLATNTFQENEDPYRRSREGFGNKTPDSDLEKPKDPPATVKETFTPTGPPVANVDVDTDVPTESPIESLTSSPTSKAFSCQTNRICPNYQNRWYPVGQNIYGEGEGDHQGKTIAMSCDGSVIVVGSPSNFASKGDGRGSVRVYRFTNGNVWEKVGIDIVGVHTRDGTGTSLAINGDGSRVAVGARWNDEAGVNAGQVRVFDYKDGWWVPVGQDLEGEAALDQVGRSVSLDNSGDRIAIGGTGGYKTNAGHARVYEFQTDEKSGEKVWKALGSVLDGEDAEDFFGKSVSLSGNGRRVAVGGHRNDGDNDQTDIGHVRVLEYDDKNDDWKQVGPDIDGPFAGSWFGFSLDLNHDGNFVAVGAPGDSGMPWMGQTFVFQYVGFGWALLGGHGLPGGWSVAITGDGKRVVTGTHKAPQDGRPNSGLVTVSDYNGTHWSPVGGEIVGQDGEFTGSAVAVSRDGSRIAASSPSSDAPLFKDIFTVGRVEVFDFC